MLSAVDSSSRSGDSLLLGDTVVRGLAAAEGRCFGGQRVDR